MRRKEKAQVGYLFKYSVWAVHKVREFRHRGIRKRRRQGVAIAGARSGGRGRSTGVQFKPPAHERKERIPGIKQEILEQGFDMLKELAAFS